MQNKLLLIVIGIMIVTLILQVASSVEPNGASVTAGASSRPPSGDSGNVSAFAGNVTLLTIFSGNAASSTWQGYFGDVTGGLRLADSTNNVLYNWSLVSAQGEVYASTNDTITWVNIQCLNFTANGTFVDETGSGGTTNQAGLNVSILNDRFNINESDLDGVNNTFENKNHDAFFTAGQEFSSDECQSVQLFSNNSQAEDGRFEEILLYEPGTGSLVFTSIIEQNYGAFNGDAHDFEMIVLEDGHNDNTDTTTYFFFVEVE